MTNPVSRFCSAENMWWSILLLFVFLINAELSHTCSSATGVFIWHTHCVWGGGGWGGGGVSVCLSVNVCVRVYVSVCVCLSVCVSVSVRACVSLCVRACVSVGRRGVGWGGGLAVCVGVNVCMKLCMYIKPGSNLHSTWNSGLPCSGLLPNCT